MTDTAVGPKSKDAANLCLKSPKSFLDTVSTGSGSGLVSDQHAIFRSFLTPKVSPGRYRSLY